MRIKITNIAGMNGYIDPAKLSESEFALLENYTLKSYGNVGSLVSRPGIQRYGDTQIASGGTGVGSGFEATLNGTDYMITNIINGGSSALYYKQSPYSTGGWTAITGANGSAQAYKLNYASFKDKVYIANRTAGASTNAVWDGTTAGFYDMGCPPPSPLAITFTQVVGGGQLSAGQYRYLFTFLYDDGQESPAITYYRDTSSNDLAPATTYSAGANDANQIDNIPVSTNARVTARKIYRTKAGAYTYHYHSTIRDNVTTTVTDGSADNYLGAQIDASLISLPTKPQPAKYVAIHKERTVLAYLTESIYTAIPTADITLTEDAGGSLDLLGTYKYRFYKAWRVNNGIANQYDVVLSAPLEKTITLTGANRSVLINYTGSDDWFKMIAYQRTDGGGSEFKWISETGQRGRGVNAFPVDDGVADGGVILVSNPTFADNLQTTYPGVLTVSDAGKPDLFSNVETAPDGTLTSASNEWNIGEPITGIHNEENRIVIFANNNIHELDTRSQSRIFWNTNKIVSGIGADDGLQCQVGDGYCFIQSGKRTDQDETVETVYYWDGRGKPQSINDEIITYLWDNGISEYLDIKYDSANDLVQIIATNTGGTKTYLLVYNIGIGKWEIYTNSTNLNLKILCYSKNYGMLIGAGEGYLHRLKEGAYRDVIAGSGALFTTKLRTKTFETFDSDLMIKNFRADITSTGAITPSLKTAVDGTLNSGDNMPALASGFNRPRLTGFTNAQGTGYRQVYFQLEMSANEQHKVHGLMIDFDERGADVGGR